MINLVLNERARANGSNRSGRDERTCWRPSLFTLADLAHCAPAQASRWRSQEAKERRRRVESDKRPAEKLPNSSSRTHSSALDTVPARSHVFEQKLLHQAHAAKIKSSRRRPLALIYWADICWHYFDLVSLAAERRPRSRRRARRRRPLAHLLAARNLIDQ